MFIDENRAVALLRKYSNSKHDFEIVIAHSKKVQEVALEYANAIEGVDIDFIRTAAILHDIGRFRCPPWRNSVLHGVEGGKILRKEGLPKYARVAERHLGAGITTQDITQQGLNLPKKDFVPKTVEEKIITISDKLVKMGKRISIASVCKSFKKDVNPQSAGRIIALYREVEGLKSGFGKAQRGAAKAFSKDSSKG